MVYILMQMEQNMKDIGKIINNMEQEKNIGLMVNLLFYKKTWIYDLILKFRNNI